MSCAWHSSNLLFTFDLQKASGDYQLTAYATVSFNETSEQTTDDQEEPDEDDVSAIYNTLSLFNV